MRKVFRFLLISTLVVAGLWFAWIYYFPKAVLHYRLDVTFEVNGMRVTGSGVQKLVVRRIRGIGQKRASWRTYGEAVRINLPGHGAVYVLMTSPTPNGTYTGGTKGRFDWLVSDACKLKEKRGKRNWDEFVRMVGEVSGSCDVPREFLPLIIRFRDEADPTTIERIDVNDLESVFDRTVQFAGARISITGEGISVGIGKYLKWLSPYQEPLLQDGPPSSSPPFPQIIKHGYFRRGEK